MHRHAQWAKRPALEPLEGRELPSGVVSALVNQASQVRLRHPQAGVPAVVAPNVKVQDTGNTMSAFTPATSADPRLLAPQGQPTHRLLNRTFFRASYEGPFNLLPGRTDTEARQVFIRGTGTSTAFLHGTIQIHLVVLQDQTAPVIGTSSQQDRSINNGGLLGFNLNGDPQLLDKHGLPTNLTYTIDINVVSGTFADASGQGTLQIRYTPQKRHFKGQRGGPGDGTAFVKIQGLLLTQGTTNATRNADIGI
jgi:hypothetical protein